MTLILEAEPVLSVSKAVTCAAGQPDSHPQLRLLNRENPQAPTHAGARTAWESGHQPGLKANAPQKHHITGHRRHSLTAAEGGRGTMSPVHALATYIPMSSSQQTLFIPEPEPQSHPSALAPESIIHTRARNVRSPAEAAAAAGTVGTGIAGESSLD